MEEDKTDTKQVGGCKSGRKYSKGSPTYQLFERYFLELREEQLPVVFAGLPKGKAVNLAMGLNRCHVQWAQEVGLPGDHMGRSAKAKPTPEGSWLLEISKREAKPARPGWIGELLALGESQPAPPVLGPVPLKAGGRAPANLPEEEDACTRMLREAGYGG